MTAAVNFVIYCVLFAFHLLFCYSVDLSVKSNILIDTFGGRYTNVKIGQDGLPLMIYNSEKHGCPRAVHCNDRMCNQDNLTYVNIDPSTNGNNGRFIFMKMSNIDTKQYPMLSYSTQDSSSYTKSSFSFVACNTIDCSKYTLTRLAYGNDDSQSQPSYSSFTFYQTQSDDKLGSNGYFPLIAFTMDNIGLYYIVCSQTDCSQQYTPKQYEMLGDKQQHQYTDKYQAKLIVKGSSNGKYPSIMVHNNSIPIFVYYNGNNQTIDYAVCNNVFCNESINVGVINGEMNANIGQYSFAVLYNPTNDESDDRENGIGIISIMYVDETTGGLYYANCSLQLESMFGLKCDNNVIDMIGINAYGVFPEMDFYSGLSHYGINGPILSYFNSSSETTGALKVAQCGDVRCTNPDISVLVNGTAGFGRDSSIGYVNDHSSESANLLYISFLDYNGGDDKHARLLVVEMS